jgi:hypothetical protein
MQVDLYLSGLLPPALHQATSNSSTTSPTLSTLFPAGTVASAVMIMVGSNDYLGVSTGSVLHRQYNCHMLCSTKGAPARAVQNGGNDYLGVSVATTQTAQMPYAE